MHRQMLVCSLMAMCLGAAHAADRAASELHRAAPACEAQPSVGDLKNISCSLEASSTPRRFRFKADFSGGHDDTIASMAVNLDGAPLACDKDSKTYLMGEDGKVSLHCSFSTPGSLNARTLGIIIKWSHAQYEGSGLIVLE